MKNKYLSPQAGLVYNYGFSLLQEKGNFVYKFEAPAGAAGKAPQEGLGDTKSKIEALRSEMQKRGVDKDKLKDVEDLLDKYENEKNGNKEKVREQTYALLYEVQLGRQISTGLAKDDNFQKQLDSLVERKRLDRVVAQGPDGQVVLYFESADKAKAAAKQLEAMSTEERKDTVSAYVGRGSQVNPDVNGYLGFMKQSDFYFKHTGDKGSITKGSLLSVYFNEAVGKLRGQEASMLESVRTDFGKMLEGSGQLEGSNITKFKIAPKKEGGYEYTYEYTVMGTAENSRVLEVSNEQKNKATPVDIQKEFNERKVGIDTFLKSPKGKTLLAGYKAIGQDQIPVDVQIHYALGKNADTTKGGAWQKMSLYEFNKNIDAMLTKDELNETQKQTLRDMRDKAIVMDMTYSKEKLDDPKRVSIAERKFYNQAGVDVFKQQWGGFFLELEDTSFNELGTTSQDRLNQVLAGSDLYVFRIDTNRNKEQTKYVQQAAGDLFTKGTDYRGKDYQPKMKDLSDNRELLVAYIKGSGTAQQIEFLKTGGDPKAICEAYAVQVPVCDNPGIVFKMKEWKEVKKESTTKTFTDKKDITPEGQLLYGFGYEVRHGTIAGRKFFDAVGTLPIAVDQLFRNPDNKARQNNDILDLSGYYVDEKKEGKANVTDYAGDKLYGKEKFDLGYGMHDLEKSLKVIEKYATGSYQKYGENVPILELFKGLENSSGKEKEAAKILKAYFPRVGKRNAKGDIQATDEVLNRFTGKIINITELKVADAVQSLRDVVAETQKPDFKATVEKTPAGRFVVYDLERLKGNDTSMLYVKDVEKKLTHVLSMTELTTIENVKDFEAMGLAELLREKPEETMQQLMEKFNAIIGAKNTANDQAFGAAFPPKLRTELEQTGGIAIMPLPFRKDRTGMALLMLSLIPPLIKICIPPSVAASGVVVIE